MNNSSDPAFEPGVAEVQGLYGAFSFPERWLQKIWSRGEFDMSAARLTDGRPVKVLHPGQWNHLGGPDFSGARLIIDGREVSGDVELHLYARDWAAHGHANDQAYDRVVLHVILFAGTETITRGAEGRPIPILCLLPLLYHGLEEYAAEEAMEQLAGRPLHHAQEALSAYGHQELNTLLREHSRRRWAGKVHFAGERLRRLGWEGACHHAVLEILGYRFNRAPMLSVATTWPLPMWAGNQVSAEEVFAALGDRWIVHGVRPLNHPRRRLGQYADWCRSRPEWPARLLANARLRTLAGAAVAADSDPGVGEWRRAVGITACRKELGEEVCGGVMGGTRLDNLICDGFLPLWTAQSGLDLESVWSRWFVGDVPAASVSVLQALGLAGGRSRPLAQGSVQGLLGWMLAQEEAARTRGTA